MDADLPDMDPEEFSLATIFRSHQLHLISADLT